MKLQVRLLQIAFALSLTLAIGVVLARADPAGHVNHASGTVSTPLQPLIPLPGIR